MPVGKHTNQIAFLRNFRKVVCEGRVLPIAMKLKLSGCRLEDQTLDGGTRIFWQSMAVLSRAISKVKSRKDGDADAHIRSLQEPDPHMPVSWSQIDSHSNVQNKCERAWTIRSEILKSACNQTLNHV